MNTQNPCISRGKCARIGELQKRDVFLQPALPGAGVGDCTSKHVNVGISYIKMSRNL